MVTVNLSYKSLKSCLDELGKSHFVIISVEKNRRIVSTTPEGLKAASLYHSAISNLKKRGDNPNGKYRSQSLLNTVTSAD